MDDDRTDDLVFFLFTGSVLYNVRYRLPFLYGCVEILVGISIAWYLANVAIGQVSKEGATVFAAMTALYVIVRGLCQRLSVAQVSKRGPRVEPRVL
jgi:hypothetical protein